MNTPNNRRSKNTDEAIIRSAFEVLLTSKKPISKITVREICEAAGINRSTFYAHYLDVFDLFDKVEKRMAEMVSEAVLDCLKSGGIRAALEAVFRFIYQYREFYQLYFTQFNQIGHLIGLMTAPFQQQIKEIRSADLGHGIPGEAEYQYDIFTSSMGAVLYRWLKTGCKENPDQLYEILERSYSSDSLLNAWLRQLPECPPEEP